MWRAQLQRAKEMGFDCADITDTNAGGSMLGSAGFSPTVSLDENPFEVKRLFEKYGIEPTDRVCPCRPAGTEQPGNVYGTAEIMKAVQFAAAIGIKDVVTTDTDPRSEWAQEPVLRRAGLRRWRRNSTCRCKMAADYGVRILLEPHGPITDSIKGLQDVFDRLGNPDSLGVNLDTGNSWLGGADPVEMAKVFKDKIHHVHWKDLSEEWEPKRGIASTAADSRRSRWATA